MKAYLLCLVNGAILLAWLFFVFCRTPLQELSATQRALLAIVFTIGAVEFFGTIYLCDFRDLAFIVFGV